MRNEAKENATNNRSAIPELALSFDGPILVRHPSASLESPREHTTVVFLSPRPVAPKHLFGFDRYGHAKFLLP